MKRLFLLAMTGCTLAACTPKAKAPANATTKGEQVTDAAREDGASPSTTVQEPSGATAGTVTYLTTTAFRRIIADDRAQRWAYKGSRPAVVDFYAEWCGPCRKMAPVVAQVAKAHAGRIDFYKVDIDKEQELAAALGINSIPAFLIIPAYGTPTLLTGAMPRADFERAVVERSSSE